MDSTAQGMAMEPDGASADRGPSLRAAYERHASLCAGIDFTAVGMVFPDGSVGMVYRTSLKAVHSFALLSEARPALVRVRFSGQAEPTHWGWYSWGSRDVVMVYPDLSLLRNCFAGLIEVKSQRGDGFAVPLVVSTTQ